MKAVKFVELLGCEVPLLVELERLVDPRLQVQAVLHPSPILHLKAARTTMLQIIKHSNSVADQGSLSRIPDPDIFQSRILDPTEQKIGIINFGPTFLCSHKYHKFKNYFIFEKKQIFFSQLTSIGSQIRIRSTAFQM
jgi:hypothetical protein